MPAVIFSLLQFIHLDKDIQLAKPETQQAIQFSFIYRVPNHNSTRLKVLYIVLQIPYKDTDPNSQMTPFASTWQHWEWKTPF